MNKSMKSAQSGFTLIELIVVIVILGILAATALPKFTNLGGDARLASLSAAKGALSSTSAMAHGRYLTNTSATPLPSVTIEGTVVNFVADAGYPQAQDKLAEAAGLSGDYTAFVGPVTGGAGTKKPNVATGQIAIVPNSIVGTSTAEKCYVLYSQPAATKGQAPIIVLGDGVTPLTSADCE